jgi:hypothetical protein
MQKQSLKTWIKESLIPGGRVDWVDRCAAAVGTEVSHHHGKGGCTEAVTGGAEPFIQHGGGWVYSSRRGVAESGSSVGVCIAIGIRLHA